VTLRPSPWTWVSENPHKAAALAYGGLGGLVIFITFAPDLVPRSRQDPIWQLVIGAVFVLFFTVLVWRGWWRLSAFLILSNTWRATRYFSARIGRGCLGRGMVVVSSSIGGAENAA
jgi:hypothetical protein